MRKVEGVPVPNVPIEDLKAETFDFFRKKGIKSNRLNDDVLTDSNELLLANLKLTDGVPHCCFSIPTLKSL